MQISAVILAGGRSSRMGQDKSLLPFGGYSSMAEFQYRRLESIFKDNIYISTKSDKFSFSANKVYDRYEVASPLNAIISAFETLDSDAIFILAVDMPLVSIRKIERLLELYKNNPNYECYCYKIDNRFEPTAAIYSRSVLKQAKDNLSKDLHKLTQLIKESRYLCIEDVTSREFVNLNKIEDYLAINS